MATMVLTIDELERSVGIAQAATERVVGYSKARTQELQVVARIIGNTLALKGQLRSLTVKQADLIGKLTDKDFSQCRPVDIEKLAVSLDGLVKDEFSMLESTYELGAEIRIWWNKSLRKLEEQVSHLDSIAESLHAAADPECAALMAIATEQLSVLDAVAV